MGNRIPNRVYSGHFSGVAPVGGIPLVPFFNLPFDNREVKIKSLLLDMHFEIDAAMPLYLNIPEDDENLSWWLEVGQLPVSDHLTHFLVQTVVGGMLLNAFGERFRLFRSGQYFFDGFYVQHLLPMNFYISNCDPLNNINVCATVVIELEDVGII